MAIRYGEKIRELEVAKEEVYDLMPKFPRTPTPVSEDESARLLLERYRSVFGAAPTRATARLLLTLLWHENARGKSVIQYNWGNLMVPASQMDAVPYWEPEWMDLELIDSLPDGARKSSLQRLHNEAMAGTAPKAFRVRLSHEDGLNAWLKLLMRPHMSHILDAAASGDVESFWRAVAWPNPDGGNVSYCPHCRTQAVLKAYARLYDDISKKYFGELHEKKSAEEMVISSRLASERLGGWRGERFVELPSVRRGDEGNVVAAWQVVASILLSSMGLPPVVVDGKFGERTHEATQKLQAKLARVDPEGELVGVAVDGVVGAQTWQAALSRAGEL